MPQPAALACVAAALLAGAASLTVSGVAGDLDDAELLDLSWGSATDAALLTQASLRSTGSRPTDDADWHPHPAGHATPQGGAPALPIGSRTEYRDAPYSDGSEYRKVGARMDLLAKDKGARMPSLGKVEELLQSVIDRGGRAGQDPCQADILATIGPADDDRIGFGSRMNNFVNELMVAVAGNFSFAVCGDTLKDGFARKVWQPHFSSGQYIPVCTADLRRCDFDDFWNDRQPFWIGYKLSRSLKSAPDYLYQLKRQLTDFIYNLNSDTQAAVASRLNRTLNKLNGRQYLGVHVRHGDKAYEADLKPVREYARAVQKELKVCGARAGCDIGAVFLSSDDPGVAPAMRKLLGPSVEVIEQPRLKADAYAHESTYDSEEALLQLLADIEALRQSEVFIGTASSNLGRLVFFQRQKHQKSVSLDSQFLVIPG